MMIILKVIHRKWPWNPRTEILFKFIPALEQNEKTSLLRKTKVSYVGNTRLCLYLKIQYMLVNCYPDPDTITQDVSRIETAFYSLNFS